MSQRERDAQAAKLVFAYAYWGVCLSLLVALMLVAWLDFREVGRSFDQQQAAIFAGFAEKRNHAKPIKPRGTRGEERGTTIQWWQET